MGTNEIRTMTTHELARLRHCPAASSSSSLSGTSRAGPTPPGQSAVDRLLNPAYELVLDGDSHGTRGPAW